MTHSSDEALMPRTSTYVIRIFTVGRYVSFLHRLYVLPPPCIIRAQHIPYKISSEPHTRRKRIIWGECTNSTYLTLYEPTNPSQKQPETCLSRRIFVKMHNSDPLQLLRARCGEHWLGHCWVEFRAKLTDLFSETVTDY
jgi:hypothetical protein